MTRVAKWVQELTEEVFGPSNLEVGGTYMHPEDGPIRITGGQYWGERGLSNFWYWTVIETGESKSGYGGSWPPITERKIHIGLHGKRMCDGADYEGLTEEEITDDMNGCVPCMKWSLRQLAKERSPYYLPAEIDWKED